MLRHLLNLVLSFMPPTRLLRLRRALLRLGRIDLADSACVCGRGWIFGRGRLTIGKDSWVSPGCIFHTHQEACIDIGDNCAIGPDVHFIPGSHLIGPPERRAGVGTAKPIRIDNGCWIGAGTHILGGVTVGAGTVVAAGSVVTRSLPANVLAAGVPAVVKRELPTH